MLKDLGLVEEGRHHCARRLPDLPGAFAGRRSLHTALASGAADGLKRGCPGPRFAKENHLERLSRERSMATRPACQR